MPAGTADAHRAEAAPQLGIPRTYDAALAHFDLSNDMRALRKFVTPSGNIYCNVGTSGPKGCEINEGSVKDPDVCSGTPVSDRVGRIEFRRGRAVPVCNTDTIRKPGAKVLPYGSATTFEQDRLPEREDRGHLHQPQEARGFLPAQGRVRHLQRRLTLDSVSAAAGAPPPR